MFRLIADVLQDGRRFAFISILARGIFHAYVFCECAMFNDVSCTGDNLGLRERRLVSTRLTRLDSSDLTFQKNLG
jgi:hypothetical protein